MHEQHVDNNFGIKSLAKVLEFWFKYLKSKWLYLALSGCLFGIMGICYAVFTKTKYTAEIVFAADSDASSPLGNYASLASQLGFGGGSSITIFEGDNLLELFKSKTMIYKTLLSHSEIDTNSNLLIEDFLLNRGMLKKWEKDTIMSKISFHDNWNKPNRARDSILSFVTKQIIKGQLKVDKLGNEVTLISVNFIDINEKFAKNFIENLSQATLDFYIEYKSSKAKQNVSILQKQADSIKNILSGNIQDVASSTDININPLRQTLRTNTQRHQVDLQASSSIYIELLKNLELAKISLRKVTPLIQIIDKPMYPLEKKSNGKISMMLLFSFAGVLTISFYFIIKKIIS